MSAVQIVAIVLMSLGVLLAVVAVIGVQRFNNVLGRMHASSKPQTLGLILTLLGVSLVVESWSLIGMMLLVLLAQMLTVPVASVMVGRAAFRRGFVRGGEYAIDELSPRLADPDEGEDDDEDGFVDEFEGDEDGTIAAQSEDRFPENVVPEAADTGSLAFSNWDEPEPDYRPDEDMIDVDLEDETEREAVETVEKDRRD